MRKKFLCLAVLLSAGCAGLAQGTYNVSFPQARLAGLSSGYYAALSVDQKLTAAPTIRIRLGLRNTTDHVIETSPFMDQLWLRSKAGTVYPVDLSSITEEPYRGMLIKPGVYASYDLSFQDKAMSDMILANGLLEMEWKIGSGISMVMSAHTTRYK